MGNRIIAAYDSRRLYLCDPEKNVECRKTACQTECFHTSKRKYSKDGKVYHINLATNEIENIKDAAKAAGQGGKQD